MLSEPERANRSRWFKKRRRRGAVGQSFAHSGNDAPLRPFSASQFELSENGPMWLLWLVAVPNAAILISLLPGRRWHRSFYTRRARECIHLHVPKAPPLRKREHRLDSKQSPSSCFEFIAASRTPPWLPSGWGCRGRRLSRGRRSLRKRERTEALQLRTVESRGQFSAGVSTISP
jgi:hypothetical protein